MASLFSPAASLMRRLRYREKLALVGALLALPLIVVLLFLVEDIHEARTVVRQERTGNQYLQSLQPLLQGLQEHRGLSRAVYSGASSLQRRQREARREVDKQIARIDALEPNLEAALGTSGAWSGIKSEWRKLRARNSQLTSRESVDQHAVLINHVLDLTRRVSSKSRLLLDPELHSHHLMATTVHALPSLTENLSRMRGWAAAVGARGRRDARDRFDFADLNGLIGSDLAAVRGNLIAAFADDSNLRPTLEPVLQQAAAETRSYLRLLIQRIFVSDGGSTPADELWLAGKTALEANRRLYEQTAATLDQVLAARVVRLHIQELLFGSLALSALLAAVYLLVGFHGGVMDTVAELDTATRHLAPGDADHQLPSPDSSRDELAAATRTLATVAEHLYTQCQTTQRQLVEAAATASKLGENQAHTSAIMSTAADGMITIDQDGIVQSFNSAAKIMFGYSASEVIGKNVSMLIPSPHKEKHDEYLARYLRTGVSTTIGKHRDLEGRREDGTLFPIRLSVSEMTWEGKRFFSGIVTDLSAQRRTEEQLKEARAAARGATRLIADSLANLSNSLRAPLNGILGMAQLACENTPTGEPHEFVSAIRSEAEGLLSVLNDVLDFSQVKAGEVRLDRAPFCLRESLPEVIAPFAVRAQQKGVELVCDVAADVPESLSGDVSWLGQTIGKLLENAVTFTEAGEIVLRVTSESRTEDEVTLRFAVADSGVGIPPEDLETIFQPFAHAGGSARERRHLGSGLGLTIASSLTAIMGGHMNVESTVGKGTTFHFTAPFSLDMDTATGSAGPEESALQGQRVLVVDDSEASRQAFTGLLGSWRARAEAVGSGPEALTAMQQAQAEGVPFALVLADVHMHEMDGFDLLQRIREDAGIAGTPVLLLTPSKSRAYLEMAQSLGAAGCFTKPCVATRELEDLIQNTLDAAPSGASPSREDGLTAAASTKGLHVLLAEDDEVNRLVAGRLVQRMGHTVVAVENGRKALAALEQQEFDLILMDVQMPEMDGLEASARIRAREQDTGNHVPIVALTAFALAADRERCSEAGMDAYVTKPLQEAELLATIERLVQSKKMVECLLAQEPDHPEVLDREALRANVGSDPGALLDLVTRFLGESQSSLEQLRHGITSGDAPSLEQAAHRLKGSLREVAATAARATALRLEAVARVGDLEQAADVMFVLEDELSRLEPQLTSLQNDN